jgi:type IV pilus assembly protein PilW
MLMRRQSYLQHSRPQRGVSLIELMIAMTIGVLVLIALTALYIQSSRSRNVTEHVTRQIESGRYALQVIAMDLQNAGYYGEFDPRPGFSALSIPAAEPDPCDTVLTDLQVNLVLPVQGYDNSIASTSRSAACNLLLADQRPVTDVLIVRRASGCIAGTTGCDSLVTGDYVFQASLCNNASELNKTPTPIYFTLTLNPVPLTSILHKKNCTTVANQRRFLTNIYYVANNNKGTDGVPTLKRWELGAGGFGAAAVALADGVENLQIEWGIDNTTALNATGAPIAYVTNPDSYSPTGIGTCTWAGTPSCGANWQAVVSAKIYIVARSNQIDPGYTDSKNYQLGLTAYTPAAADLKYERHVYQTAVRLYNPSYRNSTQ